CRNCIYGSSVSDDSRCRYHAIYALKEIEADLVVFADVYDRVYNERQTAMLSEIARLVKKYENETPWIPSKLGDTKLGEARLGERHNLVQDVTHDLLAFDPFTAYVKLLQEVQRASELAQKGDAASQNDWKIYLNLLNKLRADLEGTQLLGEAKRLLLRLNQVPSPQQFYKLYFEAQIKPAFIGSRLVFEGLEQMSLLDDYVVKNSSVQIFSHPDKPSRIYSVNPPEYSLPPEKYFVLSKAREVVASFKPGKTQYSQIAKSRKYFERVYESTIYDIAKSNNVKIDRSEIEELAEIVARYTVGYGILEILLSDRNLTDIYLDAPIGQKPIYVVHSQYGLCQTNIFYTDDEAEAIISKLRAMSGRPFDEAHPVLDFDLEELETRVAVIGPPLSPDGAAFAFRLHKVTPWTLAQFIDVKMLPPLAASLFSFFIDAQATTLVTGSRGSGKTSLMQALMLEILQNNRILVQEDTLEIPVPYMQQIGFNIQRLKTRSPISVSKTESEVAPEESLRTALRLGDSAIVLGEVRSLEAKVLYEAMRIGAAGNIIMGTIHGDSAYSVWDRIVNDLEVKNTSFKATDVVIVARPIRFAGSMERSRRVVQVTEVGKHWSEDPEREGGLIDLMSYDAKKDKLELEEDVVKKSEMFQRISKISGLSYSEIWQGIRANAASKEYLVGLKNEFKVPELLEAENVVAANNKWALLKEVQLKEHGSVDYSTLLPEWKEWSRNVLLKRVAKKRK
ncbi:MAG: type II/IV secretion system ATPase subunit, partial [Candidatus Diapherotrites archaeon]